MIGFTTSFNSTSKTLTISISDWDAIVTGADVYIKLYSETDWVKYGTIAYTGATDTGEVFYSDGSITMVGVEDDIFPDGVYEVRLIEEDDDPDTELDNVDSQYSFTIFNAKCCLSSQIAEIVEYDFDDCKRDKKINELTFYKIILEGAEHDGSSDCGDYEEASNKLAYVTEYCSSSTSDCFKTDC